ncbi:hypothetical protein [Gelidibacter mesophilus]|uniref:hypothetical protein n=1 Tax=Gelidibacter mesophilus TaxID=169050 RepID=UPI0012FABA84|nr:hypothetical protein [Gelidibacter mesophilus]
MELTTLNIKLNPLKEAALTEGKSAYVLFNDKNSEAEVFLPSKNKGILLKKTNEGNWSNTQYTLISWKGYVLQENNKAIFGGE